MGENTVKYDVDQDILINFLDESEESLATLDSLFVGFERDPHNEDIIGNIFRVAHSIKGLAAFLGLRSIKNLTHELETVLTNIRDDKLCVSTAVIDSMLKGFDEVSNMVARVRASKSQVADEGKLQELMDDIGSLSDLSFESESKDVLKALDEVTEQVEELDKVNDEILEEMVTAEKGSSKEPPPATTGRTMRVSEEKVDVFMRYVGDLIEMAESFNLLQKRIDGTSNAPFAKELKGINQGFNRLSDKLQKSLLAIRKVPAGNLVQKIPRMVRDLSNSLGKKVQVEVRGQDVQIDKSMIEALESPINHLVRNCVDHGIESPEARKEGSKNETGTIKIDVSEQGDDIIIKIQDDGGGIDPAKIRKKAVQMGLINSSQEKNLSDREIIQFVFSSGFSTAQKVTDISGRGVGMDVVRTNINSLKGSIELDSCYNHGTTVTLCLPSSLTVLVVDGMLVDVASEQYIIKLEDICELIQLKPEEITTINAKAECLHIHGKICPLIRLHELFGVETEFADTDVATVVLTKVKDDFAAILVDKISGQQRVVVKEVQGLFFDSSTIAGAAILASGSVGLVLDIAGIIANSLDIGRNNSPSL